MAGKINSRREITVGIAIALGLIIGIFIKRVHIGLLLGLGIGIIAAGLVRNRK
ncbi:MAG: hypothetical protein H7Y27_09195 [Gemmatimonadaceae bacterium]|nr:hypothetical protein [Chitinophagaceae bacterium]